MRSSTTVPSLNTTLMGLSVEKVFTFLRSTVILPSMGESMMSFPASAESIVPVMRSPLLRTI
jgi:hypothetical protein